MLKTDKKADIYHEWQRIKFNAFPCQTEELLGWPGGTLQVLQQGFELGLNRSTPWSLKSIPAKEQKPYVQASKIYKRGVALLEAKPASKEMRAYTEPKIHFESLSQLQKTNQVVVEEVVHSLYRESLPDNCLVFPSGEKNKTLDKLAQIVSKLRPIEEPLLIVGGGVFLDMLGFAAAILNKEVCYVPTTLLAAVDACIGGKTGVNFAPFGKNQLGCFRSPAAVYVDLNYFHSLKISDWRAGLAEACKHGFIQGDEALINQCKSLSPENLKKELLLQLMQVKADIVKQDFEERGVRAVLNLGHTFAHALEGLASEKPGCDLNHGEAVGVGLLFAFGLSCHLGYMTGACYQDLCKILTESKVLLAQSELEKKLGVPLSAVSTKKRLFYYLGHDKKQKSNNYCGFVLLKEPGVFVQDEGQYVVPLDWSVLDQYYSRFLRYYGLSD